MSQLPPGCINPNPFPSRAHNQSQSFVWNDMSPQPPRSTPPVQRIVPVLTPESAALIELTDDSYKDFQRLRSLLANQLALVDRGLSATALLRTKISRGDFTVTQVASAIETVQVIQSQLQRQYARALRYTSRRVHA